MGRNVSAADTLLRQWHMLKALPRHPRRVTTGELRASLEAAGFRVTPRTIQRDLLELSAVFPVHADERARPFGWSWAADAPVFDLPGLSTQEALAFAMVDEYLEPLLPHALLGQLEPYFRQARRRLAGHEAIHRGGRWLGKIAVVQPTQALIPPKVDAKVQQAVTDGLLRDRRLEARYRRKGERAWREYELNPLGLVQRGPVTYLIATVGRYDDPLLFTLHRFKSVMILDEPARRPKGFELASYLGSTGALHYGKGGKIRLDAWFDAANADHLFETPLAADQSIRAGDDGRMRVRATILDTPQLRWWLLGLGPHVEIVGPASLRREFAAATAAMAARYASQQPRSAP